MKIRVTFDLSDDQRDAIASQVGRDYTKEKRAFFEAWIRMCVAATLEDVVAEHKEALG